MRWTRSHMVVLVMLFTWLWPLAGSGYAAIRGPGNYSGVVIFDRWGGCILHRGPHIMYIGESVKEALGKQQGQFIQVTAKKTFQIFSGEARIDEFVYLGRGPAKGNPARLTNLKLECLHGFTDGEQPSVLVNVVNSSKNRDVQVCSEELAPTLLKRKTSSVDSSGAPSDGPSCALITCQTFWIGGVPRWEGRGDLYGSRYAWSIGEASALPKQFVVGPGEKKQIRIKFDLPEGEYDFLLGYGGLHDNNCVASNLVAFDVGQDGQAKVVEIKGR